MRILCKNSSQSNNISMKLKYIPCHLQKLLLKLFTIADHHTYLYMLYSYTLKIIVLLFVEFSSCPCIVDNLFQYIYFNILYSFCIWYILNHANTIWKPHIESNVLKTISDHCLYIYWYVSFFTVLSCYTVIIHSLSGWIWKPAHFIFIQKYSQKY
jgi:hypothetical protein